MIIVFIGPPKSGKDTQAKLLGKELSLPVFSMGGLIRQARQAGNPKAIEGFENYSMKGMHLPIGLKFDLLKEKLEELDSFILDNFPATQEDLNVFNGYLNERKLKIDKVFYISISVEEMMRRAGLRGREDDNPEIIRKRGEIQDRDRIPVIEYFKNQGTLEEITGEREIEAVHAEIMSRLGISRQEKNGL